MSYVLTIVKWTITSTDINITANTTTDAVTTKTSTN